jgi:biotin synthase-like enzyme
MAFMAGANAIFAGEKLLTTANPEADIDMQLLGELGIKPRAPYKDMPVTEQGGGSASQGCGKPGGCGCAAKAA